MANIGIKNLTFGYDSAENIFENVTVNIDSDWKLGLIGRNGKGKTTLLKLLNGELSHSGKIETITQFEYFPFETDETLTVNEILDGYFYDVERWKIERELNLLGFTTDIVSRVFGNLSKGEQCKVQLAILFARENAFMLIDEPTNHLDAEGRVMLSNYLNKKKSFIVVSHDRDFLDNCVNHIMAVNRESIEICGGNYSTYIDNKTNRDEDERRKNDKLENEIDKLSRASKRTSEWSDKVESTKYGGKNDSGLRPDRGYIGAKSAKMMKRAKAIEGRIDANIDEKSKLLKDIDRTDGLKIFVENYRAERLIDVKNLAIVYGGKAINTPITFDVERGDRIALIGKNGSGKTSILKAFLGELEGKYEGEIIMGSGIKISYCPQDASNLVGNAEDFCIENHLDKTLFTTLIYKFGLDKKDFKKSFETMSLGQRKKMLLAKSLSESASLFIWDEPLNYIDIISRKQLEDAVLYCKPTIIFIEHDKHFVERVATKKILL